jgi:hypothetical protein
MVGQILEIFLKKKARLAPWMEEGVQNLLAQIGSCVLWIPSITNVLPLLGGDNKGGYGVVRKVQIKRFNCIPNMIELARKTSNTDDKWEVRKERLGEALACMCEHPSVIKFLAIHVDTMEVYTLWWNGGTIRKMLDYNTKYSPIMDNQTLLQHVQPNMEGRTWFIAFR